MQVISKRQFFTMWEAGLLGNRTHLWRDPHVALDYAQTHGLERIGFREVGKGGNGAWETAGIPDVLAVAARWQHAGRTFLMDDGCPDDKRILQGELCRTHRGLEGFLDVTCRLPMRQAIAAGHMRACSYATVNALLEKYMDPSSRDDVEALFELFPDATVEFSTFSCDVGVMLGRNTLFWETRNY